MIEMISNPGGSFTFEPCVDDDNIIPLFYIKPRAEVIEALENFAFELIEQRDDKK